MLLEMHTHSAKYSGCSQADTVGLVKQVQRKELQGIIITEHHYLWGEDEIKELRRQAEIDDNFLIFSGQEVETDIGHVLVFGADRSIRQPLSLSELHQAFPQAALVWAHPFRRGALPSRESLLYPLLDAIEIFSMNQTVKENYLGLKAWHEHKFIAISGSDAHSEDIAGTFPTQFDHPVTSMDELVAEIKEGRLRPFFKEIPRSGSNVKVTEITIGTKGADESRSRIILKNIKDEKKWQDAKASSEITEILYKNGFGEGQFRVPRLIDINDNERLLIEEGQRGKNLFELITHVNTETGIRYFKMASEWLARLHKEGIKIGNIENAIKKERRRFDSYVGSFARSNSPYLEEAQGLVSFVQEKEEEIFSKEKNRFILNHGDYHPKNIIIGQDMMQDITTLFISVIDFGNAMLFPPAFDVGYFLSQFYSQLGSFSDIIKDYKESYFIDTYLSIAKNIPDNFIREVNLFKIRANLSIASYFIKVGKGQGQEMKNLISKSTALKETI